MSTPSTAEYRATMPSGTNTVLDRRSLEKGNEHIIPFLKEGMRVLDVGCGTGAITKGIAEWIKDGSVTGIDISKEMVEQGKENYKNIRNLSLEVSNIFDYGSAEGFDLITSARTLQWLSNPEEALKKMKTLLKPGGVISILDYNHEKIEWKPSPPESMQQFYNAFLAWRKDAGMNNRIADDLPDMFTSIGMQVISVVDASEVSHREHPDFHENVGIWTKVAETRGKQVVQDRYITEAERLQAIEEYNEWNKTSASYIKMYLLNVSGRLN